mgnify:CR=1 FL=1
MATLKGVIDYVDEIKPNAFSNAAKTQWINECEGLVQTEVLLRASEEILAYSYDADQNKTLLTAPPHDKIYGVYLAAMIDFANGEYSKYQNTMQVFNGFFGEYIRWFARNYRPADTHQPWYDNGEAERGLMPWRGYYLTAYGIALKHGYQGTEEEWLASLHGKDGITPDMSEYPKTSEVTSIVETVIAPMAADAHTHDNKAALDSLTPELFTELYELQQFEDQTKESLHTLKESVDNFSNTAHTHENKAVLDKITQEMLDDIASIGTVVGQAHWHHNLTTLNSITESHVTRWNEAYTTSMNLTERVGVNEGVFERFKTEILYDMQGAKTSITEINTRLAALEEALSGVEDALADIVEVSE